MRAPPDGDVPFRRLTSGAFSGFSDASPRDGSRNCSGTRVIMSFVTTTKTKTTMTTATKVAG